YTVAALAARAAWQTVYMLVSAESADEMSALFEKMKLDYLDPPRVIPELSQHFSSFGIGARLSEIEMALEAGRQEPPAGLTLRQFLTIYDYAQLLYLFTNRALRENNFAHPDFLVLQAYIEALSSALANVPNYLSRQRVRRRVTIFPGI